MGIKDDVEMLEQREREREREGVVIDNFIIFQS